MAVIVFAIGLCAGLQACSGDPSWPALGKISDLDNVMTPEQRQKTVQDIQKDDPSQSGGAAKTASKQDQ